MDGPGPSRRRARAPAAARHRQCGSGRGATRNEGAGDCPSARAPAQQGRTRDRLHRVSRHALAPAEQLCRLPARVLHGGLTRGERRLALEQFASGRHPILLATDAAGEGLNLHHHCRVVINLELPWNPTRLEQRAGRVDRIGQRRTVHAFHLIASDTAEMRVLERLKWRIARAQHAIDAADPLGSSPGDEEDLVSRLVIAGETVASVSSASDAKPSSGQEERLRIIRLEDEAAVEHARLVWGRAFLARNDQDPVVVPAAEAGRRHRAAATGPLGARVAPPRHRPITFRGRRRTHCRLASHGADHWRVPANSPAHLG